MEFTDIQQLKYENFSTRLEETNGKITLFLAGEMDMPNPGGILTPYFKKFHEKIYTKNIKEIDLNVEKLTYINSTNIKVLLDWLLDIKSLDEEKKYNIHLLYNKNILWQITAFRPLSIFAEECFSM